MTLKKATILGCGKIAGLGAKKSKISLTHAQAIQNTPGILLSGCYDLDPKRAKLFARQQKVKTAFSDLTQIDRGNTDVLVIASNTDAHFEQLRFGLEREIPYILCEKPLSFRQEELLEIDRLATQPSCRSNIVLNFQRRHDLALTRLAKSCRSGKLGHPLHFDGKVIKGLVHNGSHLFDLIDLFLGAATRISSADQEFRKNDYYGTFQIATEACGGVIFCTDATLFSLFELSIYFEKGKVEISNLGRNISLFARKPSRLYPGVFEIANETMIKPTLDHALSSVYRYLLKSDPSESRALLRRQIKQQIFITQQLEGKK